MTTQERIELGKSEILRDIKEGYLPKDVKTFQDLHDHIDANCYGRLMDDYDSLTFDECDKVQYALDNWIKNGFK